MVFINLAFSWAIMEANLSGHLHQVSLTIVCLCNHNIFMMTFVGPATTWAVATLCLFWGLLLVVCLCFASAMVLLWQRIWWAMPAVFVKAEELMHASRLFYLESFLLLHSLSSVAIHVWRKSTTFLSINLCFWLQSFSLFVGPLLAWFDCRSHHDAIALFSLSLLAHASLSLSPSLSPWLLLDWCYQDSDFGCLPDICFPLGRGRSVLSDIV